MTNPRTSAPGPAAPGAPDPREERRWVTVLFADLSGFTAMSERMDPEDVKILAQRCIEQIGAQVRRFGGTVLYTPGDQVMAVFGAPVTHEDDAERAVRAGIAIRDCPLSQDVENPVQTHIGINTGEVMAGLLGTGDRRDYTVMGDVVNTAARIMEAAPPGSVQVGDETYRATRGSVTFQELPAVTIRGKEQPVPVWEAVQVETTRRTRPHGTAPLTGRSREMEILQRAWVKSQDESCPSLVTVLGEPGIGKTRLVAEFAEWLRGAARVIYGGCLPYGEAIGYAALVMALREVAGIGSEDGAATARGKVDSLVQSVLPGATIGAAVESEIENTLLDVAAHLALLAGFDPPADRLDVAPDQYTLHSSVRRFLEMFARKQPLCMVFEDIHWADAALLDLIHFVAARAQNAPLLLVTLARPELLEKRPDWGRSLAACTLMELAPLDEHASEDLIRGLCRDHGLNEEMAATAGRSCGGNPLFAEELVASIAERGGQAGPPSLVKAMIASRLDALPPLERALLQLASVLGRVFWPDALVSLGASDPVDPCIRSLEARGLIRVQAASRFPGHREFMFQHDLVRDTAYEMLPRADRRSLHGKVVDWIEQAAGDRTDECLSLLVHNAVEAAQWDRALDYLGRAAERARRAAAHRDEAALLGQALEIAQKVGRRSLLADLHGRRGRALYAGGVWKEARPELEAALELLEPEEREERGLLLVDLANLSMFILDFPMIYRCAEEAYSVAEAVGSQKLAAAALGALGAADVFAGELTPALDRLQRAARIAEHTPLERVAPVYSVWAQALYYKANLREAAEVARRGLEIARSVSDTSSTVWIMGNLGLALTGLGAWQEAIGALREARRLAEETENWQFFARSTAMLGGLHLELFDFAAAETLAEEAWEIARSTGFLNPQGSAGIDLLLNFTRRGEPGRAEARLGEVEAASGSHLSGLHAWLWKLRYPEARAEMALACGDWSGAIEWANTAIQESQARGRIKYEVAGLTTRSRALAAQGNKRAAIKTLRGAVARARGAGDPMMFLRAADAMLSIEGDDALCQEARETTLRITASLPDEAMRGTFRASEPVQRVLGLTDHCPPGC